MDENDPSTSYSPQLSQQGDFYTEIQISRGSGWDTGDTCEQDKDEYILDHGSVGFSEEFGWMQPAECVNLMT